MSTELKIFALNNSREFGEKVVEKLDTTLCRHEEREFEDGEHKSRALENVRNRDVFVIQSLYGEPGASVNDKLCRLLFFVGALKDASAASVTVVTPYLCYARKDRKTKPRDPVTTRYVAAMMESVGVDRIFSIDVHNLQAYQNAFRCQTDHLEAKNLFVGYFAPLVEKEEVVVLSPDTGGAKRAEAFRQALAEATKKEIGFGFLAKQRSMGVVSGSTNIHGNVTDKTVIIMDDLISSGTTIIRAAEACKAQGARKIYAVVTHGAFTSKANEILRNEALEKLVITNTIPPLQLSKSLLNRKVKVLDISPVFAAAINRIHHGESLLDIVNRDLESIVA
jgi:ribose-phosphate pyrophosphokinase